MPSITINSERYENKVDGSVVDSAGNCREVRIELTFEFLLYFFLDPVNQITASLFREKNKISKFLLPSQETERQEQVGAVDVVPGEAVIVHGGADEGTGRAEGGHFGRLFLRLSVPNPSLIDRSRCRSCS